MKRPTRNVTPFQPSPSHLHRRFVVGVVFSEDEQSLQGADVCDGCLFMGEQGMCFFAARGARNMGGCMVRGNECANARMAYDMVARSGHRFGYVYGFQTHGAQGIWNKVGCEYAELFGRLAASQRDCMVDRERVNGNGDGRWADIVCARVNGHDTDLHGHEGTCVHGRRPNVVGRFGVNVVQEEAVWLVGDSALMEEAVEHKEYLRAVAHGSDDM